MTYLVHQHLSSSVETRSHRIIECILEALLFSDNYVQEIRAVDMRRL
jgi:hypothetical protein